MILQVPENTADILREAGIDCEYRGIIKVKGKEPMKTYFITQTRVDQTKL